MVLLGGEASTTTLFLLWDKDLQIWCLWGFDPFMICSCVFWRCCNRTKVSSVMISVTRLDPSGSKRMSRSLATPYGVPILRPASRGKAYCGEFSELFQPNEKSLHFSNTDVWSFFASLATAATLLSFEALFGHPHLACCFSVLNLQCRLLIVEYEAAWTSTTLFKSLEIFIVCWPCYNFAKTYKCSQCLLKPPFLKHIQKATYYDCFPFQDPCRNLVMSSLKGRRLKGWPFVCWYSKHVN